MRRSSQSSKHPAGVGALVSLGTLVFGLAACASIIGVEDVTLRDPLTRDAGRGSSGEDPPPGDPGPTPPPGEDEDGSPGGHTPCDGDLDCVRLVFITSGVFNGNLGGISGANEKCTAAGQRIPGFEQTTFRAWISDDTHDARLELPNGTKGYRRNDPQSTSVANNWTDLVDGSISVPIVNDENGDQIDQAAESWTGTEGDGTATTHNCSNWLFEANDTSIRGTAGKAFSTNNFWTSFFHDSCNLQKHLICIEF